MYIINQTYTNLISAIHAINKGGEIPDINDITIFKTHTV